MTTHREEVGTALTGDDASAADDAFTDEPAVNEAGAGHHGTAWAGGTADTGTTDDTDDPAWDDGAQATDERAGAWDEGTEGTSEPDGADADGAEAIPTAGAFAETTGDTTAGTNGADVLFAAEDSVEFERRWLQVQTEFVDHPRAAVESADDLVHEVMQTLSRRLEARKDSLEGQWCSGADVDTEELRQAMQDYRAFFHRLLAV